MLRILLRVLAVGFVLAGLSHVLLGPVADAMLGAEVPAGVFIEASMDSQNRFYGAAFTVYGALLWIGAADMARYRVMLRVLFLWFFLGGLARLISLSLRGWPSDVIIALALSELLLPPLLWWLLVREERAALSSG